MFASTVAIALKYTLFISGLVGLLAVVVLAVVPTLWPSTPIKTRPVATRRATGEVGKQQKKKKRSKPTKGDDSGPSHGEKSAVDPSTSLPTHPEAAKHVNSQGRPAEAAQEPKESVPPKLSKSAQPPAIAKAKATEKPVKKLPMKAVDLPVQKAKAVLEQSVPVAKPKSKAIPVIPSVVLHPSSSPGGENDPGVPNHSATKATQRKSKLSKAIPAVPVPKSDVPKEILSDSLSTTLPVALETSKGRSNAPPFGSVSNFFAEEDPDLGEFKLVRSRKEQREGKKRSERMDSTQIEVPPNSTMVSRAMPNPPERPVERVVAPKWFSQIRPPQVEARVAGEVYFGADLTNQWDAPAFDVPAATLAEPTIQQVAAVVDDLSPSVPKAPATKPAPWSAMVHAPRAPIPFPLSTPDEVLNQDHGTQNVSDVTTSLLCSAEDAFGRNEPGMDNGGAVEVGFWV